MYLYDECIDQPHYFLDILEANLVIKYHHNDDICFFVLHSETRNN